MEKHVDVLIIGAGLSGIAAAYYLQERCPQKTYLILEAREAMGGTWDLFRYPGVRSDSDMHTLGYSFRPWMGDKAITDGESIRQYINDTAQEYGIDGKIRYQYRVTHADWSSEEAKWTLQVEVGEDKTQETFSCNFLYMATGYYDYDAGYTPDWDDIERYQGQLIHPQKWSDDIDYKNKNVVVIGSGATAVTLVPAMATDAAHVTMLQRTPTYIISRPAKDAIANWLHRYLPSGIAHQLARWKSILLQMYFYLLARWFPEATKKGILELIQEELGEDYEVEKDFLPPYNPWDQRLCLVPDSDLFKVMNAGKASIVTDTIEGFTETGLRLSSGDCLDADIIVTATGLVIKLAGGIEMTVDGKQYDSSSLVSYKGVTYSHLPNFAQAFGYTNASWTLKCELIAEYVCRLINYMDKKGYVQCTPIPSDSLVPDESAVNLTAGYIERAQDIIPKQGHQTPWKNYQNYLLDINLMRFSKINDDGMHFRKANDPVPPAKGEF